MAFEM